MSAGRDSLLDTLTLQALRDSLGQEGLASLVDLFGGQAESRLASLVCALDEGDLQEARHTAHQLKGESSSLGAVKVAGLAARLERLVGEGDKPAASALMNKLSSCVAATLAALEAWRAPSAL